MDELSNQQYKLLKRLIKSDLKKSELSTMEYAHICELGKKGLVSFETVFSNDSSLKSSDMIIRIKPLGIATYDTYIRGTIRWSIPLIISIISVLISVFALYKSSEPIKIYLNDAIMTDNSVSSNDIDIN